MSCRETNLLQHSKSRQTQTNVLQLSPSRSKGTHSSSGSVPQSLSTQEGLLQALGSPTSFSVPLICLWQQRGISSMEHCSFTAVPTQLQLNRRRQLRAPSSSAFPVSLIGSVGRTEQGTLHTTAYVTCSSVTVHNIRHILL